MPTGADDVRSSGKTGSEGRALKVTRLTHLGSGVGIAAILAMMIFAEGLAVC
jgi:hypothetical protein